jgi:hypothetical protein
MINKILIFLLIMLLFPALAFAQQTNHTNLATHQWKNRLLLVFSPSDTDNDYRKQVENLQGEVAGLKDRDVKIFHLTDDGSASLDEEEIPKAEVQRLADTYDIDPGGFTVILIGKDGGEKLRQNNPLETEKLFSVIDAMPMRQNEMRNE